MTALARALRLALLPAGLALGLLAAWPALQRGPFEAAATTAELRLTAADLVVGVVLIGCGVVAWSKRPDSRVGILLVAADSRGSSGPSARVAAQSPTSVGCS